MYCRGLGLAEIEWFENHGGLDGVMRGTTDLPYHPEFTYCRTSPGDGYRVVLQHAQWTQFRISASADGLAPD